MAKKQDESTVVVLSPPGSEVTKAVLGQVKASSDAEKGDESGKEKGDDKKREISTDHHVVIGGKTVDYTATAGKLTVKKDDGSEERAEIFYVAYTRKETSPAERPITFCFNGGPGSSSVWLHLGAFGPRRVVMDDNKPVRPPFVMVDNEESLLDVTDLVFVDPVSTGFSRPAKGQEPKDFYNVKGDVEVVAEFIRLYTTRQKRWASPKFIAGESYGTTRAAALADHLQQRHGLFPNGLILLSCALQFQTLRFDPGNEMPYILLLPVMAATAFYHGKVQHKGGLSALLAEAEAFTYDEYAPALMRGTRLSAEEFSRIASRVAELTGLSQAFVERCKLRVNLFRYAKELCRDEGHTVGRLDSRFRGVDTDTAGENIEFDPSYAYVLGPFTAAFNDYIRRELEYEDEAIYEILNFKVWPWRFDENRYLDVTASLRKAMNQNPHLRMFVANGYFDLATPYFASDYSLSHLLLEADRQSDIESAYYEAGHMMYLDIPSLKKLKADIAGFIGRTLAD